MSDCRKVTRYKSLSNKEYFIRSHNSECLVNDKNEYWKVYREKEKYFASVLSKYRGKGISKIDKGNYKGMAKEIFLITLKLILRDLIERNYSFVLPARNAGRIQIINNVDFPKPYTVKDKGANYTPILLNHKIYTPKRYRYMIIFRGKYRKLMKEKIKSGHFYPDVHIKNLKYVQK